MDTTPTWRHLRHYGGEATPPQLLRPTTDRCIAPEALWRLKFTRSMLDRNPRGVARPDLLHLSPGATYALPDLVHFIRETISGGASKASVSLSSIFMDCITMFLTCFVSRSSENGRVGSASPSTSVQVAFQASQRKYFVNCLVQVINTLSFFSLCAFLLIGYPKASLSPKYVCRSPSIISLRCPAKPDCLLKCV